MSRTQHQLRRLLELLTAMESRRRAFTVDQALRLVSADVTERTMRRDLRTLCEMGFLERFEHVGRTPASFRYVARAPLDRRRHRVRSAEQVRLRPRSEDSPPSALEKPERRRPDDPTPAEIRAACLRIRSRAC